MSIKIMSAVWELELPHSKLLVLLALADHAKDDGSDVFPSIGHTAWKVGYSDRQVTRIIAELVKDGLLVKVKEANRHRPTEYAINIRAGILKPAYSIRGDILTPLQNDVRGDKSESRGDILTSRGDIVMSPKSSLESSESNRHMDSSASPPKSNKYPQSDEVKNAFALLCYNNLKAWDLNASTMAGALGKLSKAEQRSLTVQDLRDFYNWWRKSDWRGKSKQLPDPYTVVSVWARFRAGESTTPEMTERQPPKPKKFERVKGE